MEMDVCRDVTNEKFGLISLSCPVCIMEMLAELCGLIDPDGIRLPLLVNITPMRFQCRSKSTVRRTAEIS